MGREFTVAEQKLFHAAILSNDATTVRRMLQDGISPDLPIDGLVPLYVAACKGACDRLAMIDLLVDAGANVNQRMFGTDAAVDPRTPLNGAAAAGNLACVERLLDLGADPRSTDTNERTAAHLLLTCTDSDPDRVCSLLGRMLDSGVPINHGDDAGATLLHYAVLKQWPKQVVRLLLDRGADINARNEIGWTPLYCTCDVETAELLVENGADVDGLDCDGQNVLRPNVATAMFVTKDARLVLYLLTKGADPRQRDYKGVTALQVLEENPENEIACELRAAIAAQDAKEAIRRAALRGQDKRADALETRSVRTVQRTLSHAEQARFMTAVRAHDIPTVRRRLAAGMPPNLLVDGVTPLFTAASISSPDAAEMVSLLVEYGADPNWLIAEKSGQEFRTALNCAARNARVATVERLLDCGANPRIVDHQNTTAAHLLLTGIPSGFQDREATPRLLHYLLDSGIAINQRDSEGRTLMHHATIEGWGSDVITLLITRGADINARDVRGRTPLFYSNSPGRTQAMLDLGADLHAIDNNGQNVFHYHVSKVIHQGWNPELPLHFLACGANPRQPDKAGQTAVEMLDLGMNTAIPDARAIRAAIAALDAREAMSNARSRSTRAARP